MPLTVASLIPSGTDIIAALGLGDRLVGISHECDNPIATGRPVLTSSAIDKDLTASQIDAAVSASVADQTSLYRTDRTALHRLAPNVVVSQDICDVCAVNGEVARGDIPSGSRLVMLTAVRLKDLDDDLRRVGHALSSPQEAQRVATSTRKTLDRVADVVAKGPVRRVVALDWGDPPFAAGHWVPDLIKVGGGIDVLATADARSRRIVWDDVDQASPDVIMFLPCGYTLTEAVTEARRLPAIEVCGRLGAEVWAFDATRLFSRWTPQAVAAGAQAIARVLHPDLAGPVNHQDAIRMI